MKKKKLKIDIKNVKFLNVTPIKLGSVRRIGGTVVEVTLKGGTIKLQLEQNENKETIFYHPDWQISGKNLKNVIRKVIEWEIQYEEELTRINEENPHKHINTKKFQVDMTSNEIPF